MAHSNKFSKRIVAVALLLAGWLSVNAFNVNGIYYDFVEKTSKKQKVLYREVKVSYKGENPESYKGEYIGDITIPSTVTYNGVKYYVSEIDWGAFKDCPNLTSVTIPHSIKMIGESAFSGCIGLTNIDIPNSVTNIGIETFKGCTGLTIVDIPNSVTGLEYGAFAGCTSLTTVNFDANCATYIDDGEGCYYPIFEGCVALENLNIGKNVKNIPYDLFYDCPNLRSIVVDNMNKYYDSRNNCNAVIKTSTNTLIVGSKKMVIPASVKKIENGAFYGRGVESIAVEKGNRNYDSRNNCNAVIETSTSTLIVGSDNTIIPNSVQRIGDRAFRGRSRLKNIVIPIAVKEIGYDAFCGCKGLESIIVEEGNRNYDSRNNCNALIESSTNTLIVGCKKTKIPNTVTCIGDKVFQGCDGLTSISIPNSVTYIGIQAFSDCDGLTSVTIPSSVKSLEYEAFGDCI